MAYVLKIGQGLIINRDCSEIEYGEKFDITIIKGGLNVVDFGDGVRIYAVVYDTDNGCETIKAGTWTWSWKEKTEETWHKFWEYTDEKDYQGFVYTWFQITSGANRHWTIEHISPNLGTHKYFFEIRSAPSAPSETTFFADIAEFFHALEGFWLIGTIFGLIGDGFELADTWLVWVNSHVDLIPSIDTVKSWILGTYTSIDSWMDAQPAKVKSWILGSYTDLASWLTAQESTVKAWILGTYTSIDSWMDAQPAKVKSWILGSYTDLASWLTAQEATVKGWILGSYTDLASWLTAQEATVKGWILGEYASLDEWIDAQQEKVIAWVKSAVVELLDELISTVDDWVDDRIDAIKDLVEKIIMKL